MKKILFITNSLGFGGAEKMLAFVAGGLCRRGHSVAVVNLNNVPDYVNEHMQTLEEGVRLFSLKQPQGQNKNVYYIREIRKIAKECRADVLIGFTTYPNMYAKIVGALLGVPSVMSERGDPAKTMGSSLKSRLSLAIINASRGGVFQTEGARDFYGKGLQKRGRVIPNPIFIKGEVPFVPYDKREKSVVSVGRLDNDQKRYDVMLDAFAIFSKKHPDYVLKLYGAGTDEAQIRSWVRERGLDERVRFMGLTKQPMQDTCCDGMFLITSDYEGISNALLEAMAVGLPCVSTDHTPGGARLLISNRENGLLAPVGDAQGLADAMCAYAEDPALAAKCGENAKAVTTRFAPDRIIDLWEEYVEDIVEDAT